MLLLLRDHGGRLGHTFHATWVVCFGCTFACLRARQTGVCGADASVCAPMGRPRTEAQLGSAPRAGFRCCSATKHLKPLIAGKSTSNDVRVLLQCRTEVSLLKWPPL